MGLVEKHIDFLCEGGLVCCIPHGFDAVIVGLPGFHIRCKLDTEVLALDVHSISVNIGRGPQF
jgi:hypothetical protein